jgi:hypothetical protein
MEGVGEGMVLAPNLRQLQLQGLKLLGLILQLHQQLPSLFLVTLRQLRRSNGVQTHDQGASARASTTSACTTSCAVGSQGGTSTLDGASACTCTCACTRPYASATTTTTGTGGACSSGRGRRG